MAPSVLWLNCTLAGQRTCKTLWIAIHHINEFTLASVEAVEKARGAATGDEKVGCDIIAKALRAPARQIFINAGHEGDVVVEQILEKSGSYGFDARKGEFVDMMKSGIVDPAKVTRIALQSAASVAGLMLTTEVLMTDIKDKEAFSPHAVH